MKQMSMEHYEQAIKDATAVRMIREYLDDCERNGDQPDIAWMRYILAGCPLFPWEREIMAELDCPEEYKKVTPRAATQDVGEED